LANLSSVTTPFATVPNADRGGGILDDPRAIGAGTDPPPSASAGIASDGERAFSWCL
jgi:hypothetical protein